MSTLNERITRGISGRFTVLHGDADLQWLQDTHLWRFPNVAGGFHVAVLHGTEDSPEAIDLYSQDDIDAPFLRFRLEEDGYNCEGILGGTR